MAEPNLQPPPAPHQSPADQVREMYESDRRAAGARRVERGVEAKNAPPTFDDLMLMNSYRRRNPLVTYLAPWKRGGSVRLAGIGLVLAHALLVLPALLIFLELPGATGFIPLLMPMQVLAPILCFLTFAVRLDGDRLTELYLTRMTRAEVVFGSVRWALMAALLSSAIIGISIAVVLPFASGFSFLATLAFATVWLAFFAILPLKVLRVWLAAPRTRWLAILTAPLAMIFEVAVLIGVLFAVLVVVRIGDMGGELALFFVWAATMFTLAQLFFYNLREALRWAVNLYYAEYEGTSWFALFRRGLTLRPKLPEPGTDP